MYFSTEIVSSPSDILGNTKHIDNISSMVILVRNVTQEQGQIYHQSNELKL